MCTYVPRFKYGRLLRQSEEYPLKLSIGFTVGKYLVVHGDTAISKSMIAKEEKTGHQDQEGSA